MLGRVVKGLKLLKEYIYQTTNWKTKIKEYNFWQTQPGDVNRKYNREGKPIKK